MISRNWTGLCKKEKAPDYIHHLQEDTFQEIKKIEGFIRASILKRDLPEGVEFQIITEWQSLEAIKQFAGPDYDTAVVPQLVQEMMIRYDEKVRHYEISYTTNTSNNFFTDLYKNFNERNIEWVIARMVENVQWANGMEGGHVYGHAGVRNYWKRQFTQMSANVTPMKIVSEGNVFTIQVHQVVHDLDGKLLADSIVTHIFHLENGKIALFDIADHN